MNWNEWQHRIIVGRPVVIDGESHVVEACTEWVTLRSPEGRKRRMPRSDLVRLLDDGKARRLYEAMAETMLHDLQATDQSAAERENTERLVRLYFRYRVQQPGKISTYEDFAGWVQREHGVEAPTEPAFLQALRSVYRQRVHHRQRVNPTPAGSGIGTPNGAQRVALRPGQSVTITVTVSIAETPDGRQ